MQTAIVSDAHLWWIATDDVGITHYGETSNDHTVATGQPRLDVFTDRESWKVELVTYYNINPDQGT